jgi:non-ribosomal peptide synthetase component E (peptide arylation enzyme)
MVSDSARGDSSIRNPILTADRMERMWAQGLWPGRVIAEYLDQTVERHPDKVAVLDVDSATGDRTTLSYRQLRTLANRIAVGLVALGVERGDVVSVQLPNRWPFIAIKLACGRIGAAFNPVMPIFRHHELAFMFKLAQCSRCRTCRGRIKYSAEPSPKSGEAPGEHRDCSHRRLRTGRPAGVASVMMAGATAAAPPDSTP